MRRKLLDWSLKDATKWPRLCTAAMDAARAEIAKKRVKALRLYLEGKRHSAIKSETGLDRRRVLELFTRAVATHPDGQIFGFRACRLYARIKRYCRSAPSPALRLRAAFGHAGLLRRLFERFPDIRTAVIEEAFKSGSGAFAEAAIRSDKLHALFLEECRKAKIPGNEYPFNVENQGATGLARFLKTELAIRDLRKTVNASFGGEPARRLGHVWTPMRTGCRYQCFERGEFDGYKIDGLGGIEIEDPTGGLPVFLVLERIWLLVLIDAASRAILGYHVCFGRHYSAEDVLTCLENAILPWKPRTLHVPTLSYNSRGGLPSGVIPELAYAKWGELAIDNDKSNCAAWVWERVRDAVGCVINPGPVRTPGRRQTVERFFRSIAQNVFQRLPTTTGTGPSDPRRRDPEAATLRHRVTLDELLDLVDVAIADYNGTVTTALHNRSPLDYLRFAVERKSFFIRQIPEAERPAFCLTLKRARVTVRGSLKKGVRPHVQFEGVRYYSERLGNSPTLIGRQLIAECNTRDMRTLRLFLVTGEEFDQVTVTQSWAYHAHDLRMRKAILRCIRLGKIARRDGADQVTAFIKFKAEQALSAKKPRNELAHALRVNDQPPAAFGKPPENMTVSKPAPRRIAAPRITVRQRTLNY